MKKFIIFAPSYSENNGGAIVLHKLCHIINSLGREAYLFPLVDSFELTRFNYKEVLFKFLKKHIREPFRRFKVNPKNNTPFFKNMPSQDELNEWIVVYPEITFGNPLGGVNVVRWLLHKPGFHTGNIYYGPNEIYFKNGDWLDDFNYLNSTTSKTHLLIYQFPNEYYNDNFSSSARAGTAYCIRKGKFREIDYDLTDAILIDGKKHSEISAILKKVKNFISFDPYTNFIYFASVSGCNSIVIPEPGITEEMWFPNANDRLGVAYGFENIEKAKSTRDLLRTHLRNMEEQSIAAVNIFLAEIDTFFPNHSEHE